MRRFVIFPIMLLVLLGVSAAAAQAPVQDGSLDMTFGGDGIVLTDVGPSDDIGLQIALQADDKIVIAGWIIDDESISDRDYGLIRLHPDGTPDTTFGTNGSVITDLGLN